MSERSSRRWWWVFGLAAAVLLVEAVHEVGNVGGRAQDTLLTRDAEILVLVLAAALIGARAVAERRERAAWLLIAVGLACYTAGDVIWRVAYANDPEPPWPSAADVAWELWYPFVLAGVVLLARHRIARRDASLWMDGIAAGLLVAIPSVALVLEPVVHHAHEGTFGNLVEASYPLWDIVLLGAAIAAVGMTGWRPGRSWVLLALGLWTFTIVDCVYAVQAIEGTYHEAVYDWVWPLGALLIAASSMARPAYAPQEHLVGFKAIALGVGCQVVAIGTQVYGIDHDLPHSERYLTIAVLGLIVVQLVISRPRHAPAVVESPQRVAPARPSPASSSPPPLGGDMRGGRS